MAIKVLSAWGKIATSGIKLSSVLGQPEWESMMSRVGELELEHQLADPARKHYLDKALDDLRAALSTSSSTSSERASGATGAMNAHEVLKPARLGSSLVAMALGRRAGFGNFGCQRRGLARRGRDGLSRGDWGSSRVGEAGKVRWVEAQLLRHLFLEEKKA
jgi:hypothetical protein